MRISDWSSDVCSSDLLGGGERLGDVAGCRTIDTPWSIWDFAAPDKRLTDGREPILRVRDAVQTAVAAGASAYETVVLRLSGGLESSIVAACLAQADRRLVELTLVTRDRDWTSTRLNSSQ